MSQIVAPNVADCSANNSNKKRKKKTEPQLPSVADCSAVAVRLSCAWCWCGVPSSPSLPSCWCGVPACRRAASHSRGAVPACAAHPFCMRKSGYGWVGSAQHLSRKKQKKSCNSARTAIAMAAAMALPSATRNVTAIWWRFFKFPQRHSAAMAAI